MGYDQLPTKCIIIPAEIWAMGAVCEYQSSLWFLFFPSSPSPASSIVGSRQAKISTQRLLLAMAASTSFFLQFGNIFFSLLLRQARQEDISTQLLWC